MSSLSSLVVTIFILSVCLLLCKECDAYSSFNNKYRKLRAKSAFRQRMRNALQRDDSSVASSSSNYIMTLDANSPDLRRKLNPYSLKERTPNTSTTSSNKIKKKRLAYRDSDSNSIPERKREEERRLEDIDDWDEDDGYGYEEEEDDAIDNEYYRDYGGYGQEFDLSQYSMKYHSCTSLASYSGDADGGNGGGGEDGTVFSSDNYAVFRACPSETCRDNSWSGCRYNYAEFLIPLYDYMEAQENNLKSEMEYYCGYCEECTFYEYYFGGECVYHDDCDGYEDVCVDEEGDEEMEQFFQCQAVPMSSFSHSNNWMDKYKWWKNNKNEEEEEENDDKNDYYQDDDEYLYIGLHCTGKKMQFGIFTDEECSNYIGNQFDMANATGLDIDDDDLKDYYTPTCSTCSPKEDDYARYNYKYYGGQYNEEEYQEVCEYCETLYDESAKCLSHLYGYRNMELDDYVINSQERTCAFIENVARGNVNEYGFVKGDFSFLKAVEMILAEGFSGISAANLIGMAVTFFGCIAMLITMRSLKRKIAEPRGFLYKKDIHNDPVMVTRQDTFVADKHIDPVLYTRQID